MDIIRSLRKAPLVPIATFFFFVGTVGTRPLVPMYSAELGIGPEELGLLVALFALMPMLFATTFGTWLDSHGTVRALVFSSLVTFIALTLPYFMPSQAGLYISQIIAGSGFTAFVLTGQKAMSGTSTDKWLRERRIALFSMGVALGSLVGPLVGGVSSDFIGFREAFFVLAVINLIPVVILLPLLGVEEKLAMKIEETGSRNPMRIFGYNRYMSRAFLISVLILMAKDMYIAYFPLYALGVELSASWIGVIIGLHNGGGVIMRFFMLSLVRAVGKSRVVVMSIIFSAVFFLLIPFFQNPYILALISLLIGLGLGLGQPLSITTTINLSPENRVGEVLGFRLTCNRLTQFVAPLAFGGAVLVTGVAGTFWIISALMLAGSSRLSIPADAEANPRR